MSRVINVTLSDRGIAQAIREVEDYKKWLLRKAKELEERVAYHIARDASAVFNTATADDLIGEGVVTGHVEVTVKEDGDFTVVIADGKDAVFMEFGAGVYHNGPVGQSPNPMGAGLGFTIGSYGKGRGSREVWGYRDAEGLHLTHGVPASMPLYNAMMGVVNDIEQIAREVFRE